MRFLGIDLGTASLKLATIDVDGRECASASAAYAIETPQPGWAQTRVEVWWRALIDAASRLPAQERGAVCAIGFSGQMHGVVLTAEDGSAVRAALLWPDTRAAALLDAWPEPQPNPVAPGMAGPLLRWIVQHELGSAAATRWALQPKDWLRCALGGVVATDPSDACATALADSSGAWNRAQIEALGLPAQWFAPLAPAYRAGGTLSAHAARALGLREGIVLAIGAGDTACAALGSGLARDGDALLTTGTGGQIIVLSTQTPRATRGLHAYRAATDHGYRMAAMQNVGVALEAVRGWLSYSWTDAYHDAFGTSPSATLSFLPYLTGERSPWMNPAARGGWLGLALDDSRATMMRAAFEGVAFSLRAGLDAIRADGARVPALRLAGGGSVDARWRQLLANALDAELYALDCPNAAARGAALLGGLASGHWRVADLAALTPASTLVASPQRDPALASRHARFVDLYRRTESWFSLSV
jgi:xylulokinase